MGLSIGIIGLPNVGKSTLFNALTGAQNAVVANYPFCTIEPNRAIVAVPDTRLDELAYLVKVPKVIHASVEFIDIAGLVKGASHGEGLGNQFLAQIRNTDAIVQVVRCFDDPNVVHVSEEPDPRSDIEIVNIELSLADLDQLERKIERLESEVKGDRKLSPQLSCANDLAEHLKAGLPIRSFTGVDIQSINTITRELRFLTAKPVIYAANVDETSLAGGNEYSTAVQEIAAVQNTEMVVLCARLEEEMISMTLEEQYEFLEIAGAEMSGLEQIIKKGFQSLELISFFTKNDNEVRAWNIPSGATAPKAAGVIHTDFERGFIKAEVVPFQTFAELGSDMAVKSAGKMQQEGKEYIVQDGDLIYFRFNV